MNTKIVLYTGKSFDLLHPTSDMVCIEDIAHALSQLCRYTGHTRDFYSVAQHSVLMSLDSDLPGDPMAKLLHDADEAYVGDTASPWKQCLYAEVPNISGGAHFESLRSWERKIQDVIGIALDVSLAHSDEVKESDIRMYLTEIRDLMPPSEEWSNWMRDLEPAKDKIDPWDPEFAEKAFLDQYWALKSGVKQQ